MKGRLTSKICAQRSVDSDGRIICKKIVEGDKEVSPNICRDCPAKQVSCDKLRFSLEKFSPTPIVVRYGNGHTEVWNDEPAHISFQRAACVAKIAPISDPRQCAACALRAAGEPVLEEVSLPQVVRPSRRRVARGGTVLPLVPGPKDQGDGTVQGKVIPFPQRVAVAAG